MVWLDRAQWQSEGCWVPCYGRVLYKGILPTLQLQREIGEIQLLSHLALQFNLRAVHPSAGINATPTSLSIIDHQPDDRPKAGCSHGRAAEGSHHPPELPLISGQDSLPGRRASTVLADATIIYQECPTRETPMKANKPFWKHMIAHGDIYAFRARDNLGVGFYQSRIFCFMRLGRTETLLPTATLSTSAASMRTGTTTSFSFTMTLWLCAGMATAVRRRRRPGQHFTKLSACPRPARMTLCHYGDDPGYSGGGQRGHSRRH